MSYNRFVNSFDFPFWQSFVSNLLATVIGVGLGIPAALWINRQIESRTEKVRKEKILKVLFSELRENQNYLEIWKKEDYKINRVPSLYVSLYTESWDAFSNGGELEWINDPVLLDLLATSYNRINAIKYLSNKYFDMAFSGSRLVDEATLEYMVSRVKQSARDSLNNLEVVQEYIVAVAKKSKMKIS